MATPRSQLPGHVNAGSRTLLLKSSSIEASAGTFNVLEDGAEEGEITDAPATREETVQQTRPRKRGGRKKRAKAVNHPRLEESTHTAKTADDEPELCLSIKRVLTERSSHEKVARELARCLQERKHWLIANVVRVIGISTALSLFHKTAEIQLSGGETTADGKRKKTPGGVFLTLVRKSASAVECKEIFHEDRKMQERKKKEMQLQRIMKMEAMIGHQKDSETKEKHLCQVQQEKNMEKRFPIVSAELSPPDDEDGSCTTDQPTDPEATKDDLMQKYWRKSIFTLPKSSAHASAEIGKDGTLFSIQTRTTDRVAFPLGRDRVHKNGDVGRLRANEESCEEAMEVCSGEDEHKRETEEEILAQQFDLMNEAELDFGIDFG